LMATIVQFTKMPPEVLDAMGEWVPVTESGSVLYMNQEVSPKARVLARGFFGTSLVEVERLLKRKPRFCACYEYPVKEGFFLAMVSIQGKAKKRKWFFDAIVGPRDAMSYAEVALQKVAEGRFPGVKTYRDFPDSPFDTGSPN